MDILEILGELTNNQDQKELSLTKQVLPLKFNDYANLYNALKFNETYHYVDIEDKLNFIVRFDSRSNINDIINSKTSLYVSREYDTPVIEFIFETGNNSLNYKYKFDLLDKRTLLSVKHIIENKKVYMHFLTLNNNLLYKSYSCSIDLDEYTINKFRYFTEYCYNGHCPRIPFEGFTSQSVYCLSLICDESVLEELLDITEKLQKWGSRDAFIVSVGMSNNFNVFFHGTFSNLDYYKKELSKKYELIGEGDDQAPEKPFFKYDQGLLYFFKD